MSATIPDDVREAVALWSHRCERMAARTAQPSLSDEYTRNKHRRRADSLFKAITAAGYRIVPVTPEPDTTTVTPPAVRYATCVECEAHVPESEMEPDCAWCKKCWRER